MRNDEIITLDRAPRKAIEFKAEDDPSLKSESFEAAPESYAEPSSNTANGHQ